MADCCQWDSRLSKVSAITWPSMLLPSLKDAIHAPRSSVSNFSSHASRSDSGIPAGLECAHLEFFMSRSPGVAMNFQDSPPMDSTVLGVTPEAGPTPANARDRRYVWSSPPRTSIGLCPETCVCGLWRLSKGCSLRSRCCTRSRDAGQLLTTFWRPGIQLWLHVPGSACGCASRRHASNAAVPAEDRAAVVTVEPACAYRSPGAPQA